MPPQNRFFELWLGTMNDLLKVSFEHGARLQSRQLELLMAMQIRLAEAQARQVIDFWSRFWRSAATTLPAARAGRGGPWPT